MIVTFMNLKSKAKKDQNQNRIYTVLFFKGICNLPNAILKNFTCFIAYIL